MKDGLIISALSLVPRNRAAWLMGALSRTGLSALGRGLFVWFYGVNMDEAEHPASAYPTLGALFTRKLKPSARPITAEPDALVSPVDGTLARAQRSVDGQVTLPGGKQLSVAALLGQPLDGEREVVVLYLSPRDYHRVHCPREGSITRWSYVPGTLWPVFPAAVRTVDQLFAKNERLVLSLHTDKGPYEAVLVGAFGVGRISSPATAVLSNTGSPAAQAALAPALPIARGAELGVFHLGSTVILVAPAGAWQISAAEGSAVRMGSPIGRWA